MIIQEEKLDILSVSEDFASLLQINTVDRFATYRLNYKVNVSKALDQGSTSVRISVYNKTVSNDIPIFLGAQANFENVDNFGQIGRVGGETIVSSILLHTPRCKDLFLYNMNSALISILSDFTKRINNETVPKFTSTAGNFERTVRVLTTQNLNSLNEKNQSLPVNEYSTRPSALGGSVPTKVASLNLVYNKGIEPFSFVDKIADSRVSTNKSLSGASTKTGPSLTKEEQSLSANVAGNNVANTPGTVGLSDPVPLVVKTTTPNINVAEVIRIPTGNEIDNTDLFIKFDLLNNKGRIIQSVVKTIKHSLNFENYLNPLLPPKLKVQKQGLTSNLISVEQIDKVANIIKVFKKQIRQNNPMAIEEDYKLVREIILLPNEPTTVFLDNNDNSIATIYRAISYHNDRSCPTFSSQFVPVSTKNSETKSLKPNSTVLNSSVSPNGILIIAERISLDAINVKLVRRDLTIRERDFRLIDTNHSVSLNASLSLSFNDISVKEGHIYEYKLIITNKFGSEYSSATTIEEYHKLTEDVSDLNISLPRINNAGKIDVKFDIETKLQKTNLETLKDFLVKNNTFELFEDDLKKERNALSGIITHNVERHNLTTGEKENLGTVSEKSFSDAEISKKIGSKSIKKNNSYKYVVSTQLREAETIFEDLKKTKTDEKTGRKYAYNPFKFQNPITLRNGNIITKDSIKLNYAKSIFELGNLNNKKEVIIPATIELPSIIFASATIVRNKIFGKISNEIKWKVNGDISKIDHFIITYKILQQVYFASRVHNLSNTNLFSYDHLLDSNEVGKFIYVITPIYNDYSQGNSISTNEVFL